MKSKYLYGFVPMSILWIYVILFVGEWILLKKKNIRAYGPKESLSNWGCSCLHMLVEFLTSSYSIIFYMFLYNRFAIFHFGKINIYKIFLSIVFIDFAYYWTHRLQHTWKPFWGIHLVHHQVKYFNLTAGPRVSFLSRISNLPITITSAILGIPLEIAMLLGFAEVFYMFTIHTRAITWPRFLGVVFNTPLMHEAHHGQNSKYLNKNFGGIFSFWDRIFGTFVENEGDVNLGCNSSFYTLNPLRANFIFYFKSMRESKDAVVAIDNG